MISPDKLLTDLKRWVLRLEDDLRERCKEYPEVNAHFSDAYETAKAAGRTAHPYETWLDQELTQVAVGWVLGMVFVRFLEDNGLVDQPWISGPGERRVTAGEVKEAYFRKHPLQSDNDYLESVCREVAQLPGMGDLFDQRHNPLWQAKLSGDAAAAFIEFWRKIDNDSGELVHDFTDPEWSTRFLGDLYQNLSEAAQKRFALLQTPDFVEEFILDRTLDPAIDSFGYKVVRMIDPACGSGHFLLGGFARMLEHFRKGDDRLSPKEVASLALGAIYGVDINPFAIAIARFRLLLKAWKYAGIKRLKAAPAFKVNLVVGDALLHSASFGKDGKVYTAEQQQEFDTGGDFEDTFKHYYDSEDRAELSRILGQQYHAVVANPPYITVKDKAQNDLYRKRFKSCHRKYSMAAPFMELIFELAITGDAKERKQAGYTGQITANSFMKREFGKKLVEEFIPRWDLTHVLDTSGCYIPGHGTPTVILFGKHQAPVSDKVRAVLGINGEPGTPKDPAKGVVWSAILNQIDSPGSESESVSADDSERNKFEKHPWSIGGGGAADLKEQIDRAKKYALSSKLKEVGYLGMTSADEIYHNEKSVFNRRDLEKEFYDALAEGDSIRDWGVYSEACTLYPYSSGKLVALSEFKNSEMYLWPFKTTLGNRVTFGRESYFVSGKSWWSWHQLALGKLEGDYSISFSSIATHNQFSISVSSLKYAHSAYVAKLIAPNDKPLHLNITTLLNSSVACFWMKQVFHCKGSTVDQHGARQTTVPFEDFYAFDASKLKQFPVTSFPSTKLLQNIESALETLENNTPREVLCFWHSDESALSSTFGDSKVAATSRRARMIALQEELDWQCYRLYGLVQASDGLGWPEDRLDELPELSLGERTFEILMARQMAAGELETTWFSRHAHAGSKPITELPAHWPKDYKALVERRLQCIAENKNINLIERPEYKRRWNTEPWEKRQESALRQWLLTRLEAYFHDADRMIDIVDAAQRATVIEKLKAPRTSFPAGQGCALCSTKQLADAAQLDQQWMEAAQVYTGSEGFDVPKLVRKLIEKESVPYLPSLRYKDSGLRNRLQWERTWELQRQEDAVEAKVRKANPEATEEALKGLIRDAQQAEVGDIPVPPKYKSKDFKKGSYWNLRGKLDVAKERWVIYPSAERNEDTSPVIAWAGWNHAQQIQALAAYYVERETNDGWPPEKLHALLAGMKDLLPWVKQWHPEVDPTYGQALGDIYDNFLREQCHKHGITDADLEKVRVGE